MLGFTQFTELTFIWRQATPEAKGIILLLLLFSVIAWSVMVAKALQIRRARKLNTHFADGFNGQSAVMEMHERRISIEGCPMFAIYQAGCSSLKTRLKAGSSGEAARQWVSFKGMELVKRAVENTVAMESLKLESGLIILAIAVSGAPFLGLLGTVWGVMSTFSGIAMKGEASLATMAPGVSAALVTTVAGLLVAIPSMFGYNYLVHQLRATTVELDIFAQELVSKLENEYLPE
ncbi:MAG: MotA/TolQ/ExbB proton channel family protein [Verrucomicrobiota bacterium]